jgi:hypothetical protein
MLRAARRAWSLQCDMSASSRREQSRRVREEWSEESGERRTGSGQPVSLSVPLPLLCASPETKNTERSQHCRPAHPCCSVCLLPIPSPGVHSAHHSPVSNTHTLQQQAAIEYGDKCMKRACMPMCRIEGSEQDRVAEREQQCGAVLYKCNNGSRAVNLQRES